MPSMSNKSQELEFTRSYAINIFVIVRVILSIYSGGTIYKYIHVLSLSYISNESE